MSGQHVELRRIRDKPGLFIGWVDEPPMPLVEEVLANAIDQHLAGHCDRVDIALGGDGRVSVVDHGRGISGEVLLAAVEGAHQTATLDGHRPHVHLGHLGGHGLFVVAALSEHFEIDTVHDGERSRGSWVRGIRQGEIERERTVAPSGTRVSWLPDSEIFRASLVVPLGRMLDRIEILADTLPRLEITLATEPVPVRTGPRGLRARVSGHPLVEIAETVGDVRVEAALAWRSLYDPDEAAPPRVASFVNYSRTKWGGSHALGLLDAVAEVGAKLALRQPLTHALDAAVSIVTAEVAWGTPTKDRLASKALRTTVREVVTRGINAALAARPELRRELDVHRGSWPIAGGLRTPREPGGG